MLQSTHETARAIQLVVTRTAALFNAPYLGCDAVVSPQSHTGGRFENGPTRGRARELCRFPSWCLGL
jgi:hypothetical protein